MKFQIFLTFVVFTAFKEFSRVLVDAKSVQLGEESDKTTSDCSDINVNEGCDLAEGDKLNC